MENCCRCIPMKYGCIVLASIYIMIKVVYIFNYYDTLSAIKAEENEDEENIEQRERVRAELIVDIVNQVFRIILGVTAIVAVIKEKALLMKSCAIVIVVIEVISYVCILFTTSITFLWIVVITIPLILACWTVRNIWDFAEVVENPMQNVVMYGPPMTDPWRY